MQEKMLNFNAKTQNQQVKYQTNGGSDIQPAGKQPLYVKILKLKNIGLYYMFWYCKMNKFYL